MNDRLNLTVLPAGEEMTPRELERLVLELKSELETGVDATIRENSRQREGTLGPEWLPVLTVLIGAPVTAEIAKAIVSVVRDWWRRKKPVTVSITADDGKAYVITGSNLTGEEIAIIVGRLAKQ